MSLPPSLTVFDIETVGTDFSALDEAQQEYLLRRCTTDEEKAKAIDEMALSPLTGRIVCIGVMKLGRKTGVGSDEPGEAYEIGSRYALVAHDDEGERKDTLPSGIPVLYAGEQSVLETFWRAIKSAHLLSFNGRGFDAPYLMLRSALLEVAPSRNLMDGSKFNYSAHIDLADELSFFGYGNSGPQRRFNFDFYSRAFGLPSPKTAEVHGGAVTELYRAGRLNDIAEYCMRDVEATWRLYERVRPYLFGFKRY